MYREKLSILSSTSSCESYVDITLSNTFKWKFELSIEEKEGSLKVSSAALFHKTGNSLLSNTESIRTIRFLSQKEGFDNIEISVKNEDPDEDVDFDEVELDQDVFVADGNIFVIFIVSINGLSGPQLSSIDFFKPSNCSDAVLIVEGKRFHVNKGYLSMCSKVFDKMFYSNLENGTEKEFKLDDVKWHQFYELLQQVHPGPDICNDTNIEYLLELAHRFDIPRVIDDIERFILNNMRFDWAYIGYADRYNMLEFLNKLIYKLRKDDLSKIIECSFFNDLTQRTKDALFDRALFLDSIKEKPKFISGFGSKPSGFGQPSLVYLPSFNSLHPNFHSGIN